MKHCTNDPTLLRIIVRLNLKVCMLYTFIIFRDHFLTFFTSFLCSLELCICNLQFLSFLSFVLLIVHRLCGIIFYTLITRKHYLKSKTSKSCISHPPSDRIPLQKPRAFLFFNMCEHTKPWVFGWSNKFLRF